MHTHAIASPSNREVARPTGRLLGHWLASLQRSFINWLLEPVPFPTSFGYRCVSRGPGGGRQRIVVQIHLAPANPKH